MSFARSVGGRVIPGHGIQTRGISTPHATNIRISTPRFNGSFSPRVPVVESSSSRVPGVFARTVQPVAFRPTVQPVAFRSPATIYKPSRRIIIPRSGAGFFTWLSNLFKRIFYCTK